MVLPKNGIASCVYCPYRQPCFVVVMKVYGMKKEEPWEKRCFDVFFQNRFGRGRVEFVFAVKAKALLLFDIQFSGFFALWCAKGWIVGGQDHYCLAPPFGR